MKNNEFSIIEYKTSDSRELLRLLLLLHDTYFHKKALRQIQDIGEEKDIKKSYKDYINQIDKRNNDNWKIYLATNSKKAIGFIIGSIGEDKYLLRSKIGKFEDWFVEDKFRGKGIGMKLYNELEKWFKEKGCQQVLSETWHDNEISIKAHKKLGFIITGISFGKILE